VRISPNGARGEGLSPEVRRARRPPGRLRGRRLPGGVTAEARGETSVAGVAGMAGVADVAAVRWPPGRLRGCGSAGGVAGR
jgi:hypothetical protein